MIGLTNVDMDETEQIRKSLEYGEKKLAEIHDRITELKLLERELMEVKEKLIRRLQDIDKGNDGSPS